METLGETLRAKRMEKNLTLQQISRDTYVAQRYLEALETENFQCFPAPSYVKGFLRIYAEYLGLDPDMIIEMHAQVMIQEQPVPAADLWQNAPKQKKSHSKLLIIIAAAVVLLALAILLVVFRAPLLSATNFSAQKTPPAETIVEEETEPTLSIPDFEHLGLIEQEFSIDQDLSLLIGDTTYLLTFKNEDNSIFVNYEDNESVLPIGEEQVMDIDMDGESDILLTVRSFNESTNSLVMRISKSIQLPDEAENIPVVYADSNDVETRTILRQEFQPTPFSINIQTQAPSYLRIQHNDNNFEKVMEQGETYSAENLDAVKIATANAAATLISIDEQDISIDSNNTILVLALGWRRTGNRYQLEVTELN